MNLISEAKIEEHQKLWKNTIIEIGKLSDSNIDTSLLKTKTLEYLNELYTFESPLLFKPTKASSFQFRSTLESSCSYFIGNNTDYPEDKGFALEPWTNVKFENSQILIKEHNAFAMGNYFFTNKENIDTKVEYTFGYTIENSSKKLKIFLHHSSLPYTP